MCLCSSVVYKCYKKRNVLYVPWRVLNVNKWCARRYFTSLHLTVELTAAIIGRYLIPAILPGTWGVNGVTFFHRDAVSALQHLHTETRWDIFLHPEIPLSLQYALASHWYLLTLPPETHCYSLSGSNSSSSYRYGGVNVATSQSSPCYVAPLLWTRKRTRLYTEGSSSRLWHHMYHCMLFHSIFGQKSINHKSLQHPLQHGFLCLHIHLHQHGQTMRYRAVFSKGSQVTAQNLCSRRKPH